MEQLFRQEVLLGLLPRMESAIDTKTIHERLENQGISVDLRTLQRHLRELEKRFPHVKSKPKSPKAKARIWWADRSLSRLSLLPTDAMSLVMIMDHASRFGMAAQVTNLSALHEYARSLMREARPSQDWSKKVISNTRFITLRPGKVDPQVLETLQKALLDDYAIEAQYLKRGAREAKSYRLLPLGLSYQDSNIYLSCVFANQKDTRPVALPLHRFISVTTIPETIAAPENYDINSVSTQRSLISLASDEPVPLRLLLSQEMYERLAENPLTEDQQLLDENGCRTMVGSTHLSQGLELWLLSQGDNLEVVEPSILREKMAATAQKMAALYLK